MDFKLFGYTLKKTELEKAKEDAKSFVPPTNEDGAVTVEGVGAYGAFIDLEGSSKNEFELITRYREMALLPEVDSAIDDIVNEAIVVNGQRDAVEINLSNIKEKKEVKEAIYEEFDNILTLLNWNQNSYDLFRKWYIDGRLFFHVILDDQKKKNGILELRYIDPRQIRKVREIERDVSEQGVELLKVADEYYVFNQRGLLRGGSGNTTYTGASTTVEGIKISTDSILFVHSGIVDKFSSTILSNLHKALKGMNQLKMMEDAMVIYRIARAPERRIFYVDVGNLPKSKADAYLRDIMQRYRNKMVYNIETGEVKDDRRTLSMLEDFWLPRREGCLSLNTQIDLLDGRQVPLSDLILEYDQGKQNWTYSVSPEGEIVPGLISWAGVTRKNTDVLKITLDNGEEVIATPDHKFILRDGTKIEARDLKPQDSLMPFYTREKDKQILSKAEYLEKWSPGLAKMQAMNEEKKLHNHKVVSIEILSERMDVGTLTIDKDHRYHDYHNFALSAGIFVMNSQGTSIDTLPGGENLGEMADVEYFQKKLYKALNVPVSRLDPENGFQLGRAAEITRDELKFTKFIYRQRIRFSHLFIELLEKQLTIKGIVNRDEWENIKEQVTFDWANDNHFTELKDSEILRNRLELIQLIDPYTQKYFSVKWIRKNVLKQTEDEQKTVDKDIVAEKDVYPDPAPAPGEDGVKMTNFDDGNEF